MPVYLYKARDLSGNPVSGKVAASSLDGAEGQVDSLGYIPIAVKEQTTPFSARLDVSDVFGGKVKPKDMIMFAFQISTLLGAGIPLLTTLKTLSEQTKNKKLKDVLTNTHREIEGGSTLSDSLAKHPDVFPGIYVNMIRAGEASGTLQEIFLRLGEMTEHEAETREKIDAALRYPKMVGIALVMAFVIVVTFVVPRFVTIFQQFKVALPLPTRMLIILNTLIQNCWAPLLFGVALAVIACKLAINTAKGRYYLDYLKIKAPVIGTLFLKVALSRFTHLMATLNKSGLPVMENLKITSSSIGNSVISEAILKIRESVREGRGIAAPMKEINLFTPLVVQMVSVGETTGELDNVLIKVSHYYDMEVENETKHLSTYLEPILTLALGTLVLFFALAIFLPMWDLTKIAGR